jgi:drug/metabolite transporter (DMT)-like permease
MYSGVYLLGVLLGIHWVTFFHAMQKSSVAIGMLSLFSFPIITIFLEPLFTRERIKAADMVAGLIVFAGLTIMVGTDLMTLQGSVTQGVLWGVFSALFLTLRNLFQKYHFHYVTSDSLMFHQVVAVGLMLAVFTDYEKIVTLGASDWLNLALLGIISIAGAHTLLVFSLNSFLQKLLH